MQGPSTKSFRQAFLENLLVSLQLQQEHTSKHDSSSVGAAMSLHERKLAVKSSADVAMAAARGAGARWTRAILAPASSACKVQRCRRIVIRCRGRKRSLTTRSARAGDGGTSSGGEIARRLVRRRTMALREVIPGGRDAAVDEATLLREAMDYVVHLRAQVDVLRQVSEAVQRSGSSILQ
ncbi:transcription factor IBH1-like 1 isoform X2 [Lolium perenne]|uniref:transcription factor IBH1-like 1 isoform X1 n=1 Tax=Lolium perenne TaxID=4522 RepID=UPI0021EB0638|nr:transcription factor IBH1-like 1 [Lolium perenne]